MASSHGTHGAHNGNGHAALVTPAAVTHDLAARHQKPSGTFRVAVALCAVLFILGIIGFIMRLTQGFSDKAIWGYYAAMFAFLLSTAQAAPMVAIVPRIAKGHWRRPISRAAELWSAVGLFNLLLFIPMLWLLPSLEDGRRSMWFWSPGSDVPVFSPHIWGTVALLGLVITGVMLLWVSALPDLAYLRDNGSGRQQRMAARLSGRWNGTSQQWHMLYHRMGILGAFYFIMLISVHFVITTDFLISIVPGWIDSLFPATHAVNSLQAGVATVILTMFLLRQFGGYRDYITLDQFWGVGKLLFALSLMWFWFWFSSFNVLWYGKKPNEQAAMRLLMTGPYLPIFYTVFILNFVLPLVTMIWNVVRKSILGPTLVAVSVLVGTFLDRIRLWVAAWSVPGIGDPTVDKHALSLDQIPPANLPDLPDVLIMIGVVAGAILAYLVASRIIPVINIWEQRELLLYKVHKPFHRTEVMVLGKPD